MTTPTLTHRNGVNVDQLMATVNAVQQDPDLARFQFRAHNEWTGGGHSRTRNDYPASITKRGCVDST